MVNDAGVGDTCSCLLVLLAFHPRWLSCLMMQSCWAHPTYDVVELIEPSLRWVALAHMLPSPRRGRDCGKDLDGE